MQFKYPLRLYAFLFLLFNVFVPSVIIAQSNFQENGSNLTYVGENVGIGTNLVKTSKIVTESESLLFFLMSKFIVFNRFHNGSCSNVIEL